LENVNKVIKITGKRWKFCSNWQLFTGNSGSLPHYCSICKEVHSSKLVL